MFKVKKALCIDTHHRFLVHDEVYAEWIGVHHDGCVAQSHGHTATAAQHHTQTGTDNTPKWDSLRPRGTTIYANWDRHYRQVRQSQTQGDHNICKLGQALQTSETVSDPGHNICKLGQALQTSETVSDSGGPQYMQTGTGTTDKWDSLRPRGTTTYANWNRHYRQVRQSQTQEDHNICKLEQALQTSETVSDPGGPQYMQTGTGTTDKWDSLRLRRTTIYANWNRHYRQVRQSQTQGDHNICKLEQALQTSETVSDPGGPQYMQTGTGTTDKWDSLRLRGTTIYANWDRHYRQVRQSQTQATIYANWDRHYRQVRQSQTQEDHNICKLGQALQTSETVSDPGGPQHMQTGTGTTDKWDSLRLRRTTIYANWNRHYRQVRQSQTQGDHNICKLGQALQTSETVSDPGGPQYM